MYNGLTRHPPFWTILKKMHYWYWMAWLIRLQQFWESSPPESSGVKVESHWNILGENLPQIHVCEIGVKSDNLECIPGTNTWLPCYPFLLWNCNSWSYIAGFHKNSSSPILFHVRRQVFVQLLPLPANRNTNGAVNLHPTICTSYRNKLK